MTHYESAAQRLFNLLSRGKALTGGMNAVQAWAELLGVKESNITGLLHRLGQVTTLPQGVREEVKEAGIGDVYLRHFNEIEQAFTTHNLYVRWSDYIAGISENAMTALELCAHRLSELKPPKDISDETIEELLVGVFDLMEEVRTADIDDDLKFYLLKQLRRITAAIQEYTIIGPDAIMQVVHSAIGETLLRRDLHDKQRGVTVVQKVWKFLERAALTLSVTHSMAELPGTIEELRRDLN